MLSWISEHWQDILAIYGGIVAISTIIVKWTKTDKDDKILNKIIAFFDLFSTAFSKSDKELLEKAVAKTNKK
jgi:hypothetical protein